MPLSTVVFLSISKLEYLAKGLASQLLGRNQFAVFLVKAVLLHNLSHSGVVFGIS